MSTGAAPAIPSNTTRHLLSGHALRTLQTAHQQADRVFSRDTSVSPVDDFARAERDAYLLAYALRDVRLVSMGARPWAPNRIDTAVEAFDEAAPGIKDVRDIYAHIVDYEMGTGHLQKKGTVAEPIRWLERGDGEATLVVLPYRIDVKAAVDAASNLANEALDVLTL